MRPNTHGQQGQSHQKQAIQPARSTSSWAEAIGRPQAEHQLVPHRTPTYHTVARDADYHYPLDTLPHLLLAGKYSGSTLPWNEMVFRNVFPAGQAATRELMQSHRTAAHIAFRKRLGINLMLTDAQGDIITVVTKKTDKQQGDWTTTGDIIVRFATSRAAKSAYEQQRSQHNNRDTQAERLLTYTRQICPVLLSRGHTDEASEDASLHRLHVSCVAFRGLDAGNGASCNSSRTVSKTSTTTPFPWTERTHTRCRTTISRH